MAAIIESRGMLEIQDPMSRGKRVIFLLIGFFPLLAPYQLIIRPNWESYFNPVFLFVAIISLGALAVSGFFAWAAIAGIDSRMIFDREQGLFIFQASAPVVPLKVDEYPLGSITRLSIETHEWSEGSPSYTFKVEMDDGHRFTIGTSWSRLPVEELKGKVESYLGPNSGR